VKPNTGDRVVSKSGVVSLRLEGADVEVNRREPGQTSLVGAARRGGVAGATGGTTGQLRHRLRGTTVITQGSEQGIDRSARVAHLIVVDAVADASHPLAIADQIVTAAGDHDTSATAGTVAAEGRVAHGQRGHDVVVDAAAGLVGGVGLKGTVAHRQRAGVPDGAAFSSGRSRSHRLGMGEGQVL
jgi:hypothetical protein